jgi:DNA-binding NarL/FixJ family response regulator
MSALGMRAIQLWVGPQCVRLALAAGERGRSVAVAEDVGRIASAAGTATARAAAAATSGLIEDDPDLLLAAAEAYREGGRPLDRLLASEWAGGALTRAGRREDAVAAYQRAMEVARELDSAHDNRRLLAALRDLGVRVGGGYTQRRAATGWDALTNAELDVARLIDLGLRNTEIAERLFVSRRTVETHVSRLYAKLGARSRVALAQIVHERLATVG